MDRHHTGLSDSDSNRIISARLFAGDEPIRDGVFCGDVEQLGARLADEQRYAPGVAITARINGGAVVTLAPDGTITGEPPKPMKPPSYADLIAGNETSTNTFLSELRAEAARRNSNTNKGQ